MNDAVFKAALAGLLHDVGKFGQRAAEGVGRTWDKEAEKEYKYKHALYSGDFVEKYVPKQWCEGLSGPAWHHRPQTHHDRVIALADHLSAGEQADDAGKHPRQLQSIFCSITGLKGEIDQSVTAPERKYLPLKRLAIRADTIFPAAETDNTDQAYKVMWDEFTREAAVLKDVFETGIADQTAYLESLLNLMQQFTWCIPSAYYRSVPDVSLYDHSRMTAALATCLAEQPEAQVQKWLEKENLDETVALLVGGDISGVQRFIYTLTSAGTAKNLRGRSFYLQLLTEVVAHHVLNQLGLPLTNLIYAGGGNFFLLVSLGQKNDLTRVSKEVSQRLLSAHEGELQLILAYTDVKAKEFKVGKFHTAWDRLYREELNPAKLKPLANLDDDTLKKGIGIGLGSGGDRDTLCNICGREDQTSEIESGGDLVRICPLCQSFEDLGNSLVKATHLVTLYSEPRLHRRVNKWHHGLELFGVNYWVVNANNLLKKDEKYLELPPNLRLIDVAAISLRKPAKYENVLQNELAQSKVPQLHSLRLFAQLVPKDEKDNPLTFDQLAENKTDQNSIPIVSKRREDNSEVTRWSGLKRWGVLRMDVDNLGSLFTEGFKATIKKSGQGEEINSLTLSRLASLSFSLRLFFEGWLPKLGQPDKLGLSEAEKRMNNRLYVQYSGGDDLFVVGSWDALPEFALVIRDSFREYVCRNPAVTLSGGISLAGMKYPLYQAAEDAEEAEGQAKKYRRPDKREKDALSFLGQVVGWEEITTVKNQAYELKGWCGGDNARMPRALIQNLLAIYAEYRDERDEAIKRGRWKPHHDNFYGPWRWHLAYMFGRRINDRKTPEDIRTRLADLEKDMLYSRKIETIGLAARWAQFLIRK